MSHLMSASCSMSNGPDGEKGRCAASWVASSLANLHGWFARIDLSVVWLRADLKGPGLGDGGAGSASHTQL